MIALLAEAPLDVDDLVDALKRSMRVRVENSANGGLVIQALRRNGYSWRGLEAATGIGQSTLRAWVNPPEGTRGQRP